jgi:hypothetical protein
MVVVVPLVARPVLVATSPAFELKYLLVELNKGTKEQAQNSPVSCGDEQVVNLTALVQLVESWRGRRRSAIAPDH